MAVNPLFLFLALLLCAVLVSAADLYKVLDCAFVLSRSWLLDLTLVPRTSGQVCF